MLIPIDRPLIDARNIRDAATQTVSAGFVATHNQRQVLILTCDSADRTSAAPHIQAGTRLGQLLTIILTDDANKVTVQDGGGTGTELNGDWVVGSSLGIGAWLKVVWLGTYWQDVGRGNGEVIASGITAHAEGHGSTASGQSAHAEGRTTVASGSYSHAEGYSTTAGTAAGTHAEGRSTIASGAYAHAEGRGSIASGDYSHAQGYVCTASGDYSHAQGIQSNAALYGEHAHAAGYFAAPGDAQYSRAVMRIATTDATQTEIFLDGVDDRLTILDEYTYACKVMVVGRQDDGTDHFLGTYHVLIERTTGAVALVGAVDVIYENNAGGWGAGGGLPVEITAANNSLAIKIEGLAAHNIRWVAVVEMVRVNYAD